MSDQVITGGWIVQPVVSVLHDDGTYDEISVSPQKVPMSAWPSFKDGADEQLLAQVRAKLLSPAPEDVPGEPA